MLRALWRMLTHRAPPPVKAWITIKNVGEGTVQILEVRNVVTGNTKRIEFELQPGYSKTIDVSL